MSVTAAMRRARGGAILARAEWAAADRIGDDVKGKQARRMKRTAYEKTLNRLQMELCHLQCWVKERGSAPSDGETSQVYLQRYLAHFPSAGGVVIFDRSWYNRAGVEPVMGFCTPAEHRRFLQICPEFEHYVVDEGLIAKRRFVEEHY
jgi:polyphosphate kinase